MTYITRAAYAIKEESAQVFFLLTRSNPIHANLMKLHTKDHDMGKMFGRNFVRILRTVFENFDIFMESREKKKQTKQHDCMSTQKFLLLQLNALIISSNFEFESFETHYSWNLKKCHDFDSQIVLTKKDPSKINSDRWMHMRITKTL